MWWPFQTLFSCLKGLKRTRVLLLRCKLRETRRCMQSASQCLRPFYTSHSFESERFKKKKSLLFPPRY
ncbi:Hypothetical protein, putative [Bodo saltans]|uniref:Uncharacterized protein n=1 Tax=Bodo saltans TaxID=75058 RepID=A0A0S4JCZ9_BODSA|nr:Hypothetical protein, putative [Bodo saltans]|eukprot:CUG86172.1 Hypothetical protein, putative [Bodo saltans]